MCIVPEFIVVQMWEFVFSKYAASRIASEKVNPMVALLEIVQNYLGELIELLVLVRSLLYRGIYQKSKI